ncbi:unnamed protein product [Amoebophrya sp. A120]|nr:unnamed protein product [Amoebophrya sp. A120]|eukprot:GSA120T00006978001.1
MKVVTATRDEDITMEDSVEEVLDVGVLQQVLVVDEGEAELCCECESELQLLLGSGEDAAALQIDHVDVLPVAEGQHHREDLDPSSAAETRSTSRSCDDLDARRPADDDKPPAAAFYSSSSSTTKSRVGAMKRRSACSQSGVCLFLLVIIITTVAILCSLSFLLLGSGGVLSHLGFCAGQEDCVKQKMGIGGGFSESMSHLSQHDHLRHTTGFELETTTNTAATLATPADPVGVDAASSLDCADGHDDCVGHDRSFQREESKFPVIAVQPPTARISFAKPPREPVLVYI